MTSRNPQAAVDKVAEAQAVRDAHLGSRAFSKDQIRAADAVLEDICFRPEAEAFLVRPVGFHEYIRRAVVFTWGWYSGRITYRNPDEPPLRSQVSKVVLFREAFMRHALGQDRWDILAAVCDLSALRRYAEGGCVHPDLPGDHFFLHSSLCARWLKPEEYRSIDGSEWATILYPMYEAEVLALVVAVVAAVCGVEYGRWRNGVGQSADERDNARNNEQIDNLERELAETRDMIRHLLLEMEVRETILFGGITDRLGRVYPKNLQDLYLERYLPTLESLRASKGGQVPPGLEAAARSAESHADMISPHFCEAVTMHGTPCRRPAPGGQRFCWQHAKQD